VHLRVLDLPQKIISLVFRSVQNIFTKRVNHVVREKCDEDAEKPIIDTNQGRIEQELPNQAISLLEQIPFSPEEKIWGKLKLVDTFTEVEVKMEIILIKEKETPGTWRFKEDKSDRPMTIYLSKEQVDQN